MCLGGEGEDDLVEGGNKIALPSISVGKGPVTENTDVDENISIINIDKFVLLRDTIMIPCGPDLPAHWKQWRWHENGNGKWVMEWLVCLAKILHGHVHFCSCFL